MLFLICFSQNFLPILKNYHNFITLKWIWILHRIVGVVDFTRVVDFIKVVDFTKLVDFTKVVDLQSIRFVF